MEQLAKDIYIETGYEGINVGAIITTTGIICVDTPSYARDARDWAARLHRLSPYPIQHIILTDSHGDRVLHTRWLNAAIIMQRDAAEVLRSYDRKFPQTVIESLGRRNPQRMRELSNGPVETASMSFSDEITYYKSGHELNLISAPGPARGNLWLALPRKGVLFAGDTLVVETLPWLRGPFSASWVANLKRLKSMHQYHTIVPGRGPVSGAKAIDALLDYLVSMREMVGDLVEQGEPRGATARLVREFIGRFPLGTLPVDWVRQQIEASLGFVHDELTGAPSPETLDEAPAG